jgi:very-short-patch-repair endonuclease
MTAAEGLLWSKLCKKQMLNLRFLRQYGIGAYVVDFYCPKIKLAIEIDGSIHETKSQNEYDNQRQISVENLAVTFLRFTNDMIFSEISEVVYEIERTSTKLLENKNK